MDRYMAEITVIGSLNMDLVGNVKLMPKIGETVIGSDFKQVPGGKGANQAVAIARLGGMVNMIGKVGEDTFGQELIKGLKKDSIQVECVRMEKDCATGVALILVDDKGNNSIAVMPGANFKMTKEEIDGSLDVIKKSEIVVLQLETPIEVVKYSLEQAKRLGKYTILNPAPAQKLDEEIIKNVDLLMPNETELEILSGIEIKDEEDIIYASKSLIEKGVEKLIVTLGEKGSIYVDKEIVKKYKPYPVNPVDTTAAGDSFIGAVTVSLSNGKELEEAIGFASKVGALTVTKEGAQSSLPYLKEVKAFKEEQE